MSVRSSQEETGLENRRTASTGRKSKDWLFLLLAFRVELGGAVPGQLGALSIRVRPRFVAEGVAGVIPVGLKRHLAFFQLSFQGSRSVGTQRKRPFPRDEVEVAR